MKNLIVICCSLVIILSFPCYALAQQKAVTKISGITEKEQTVNVTLTSSRPFIFANNRYILHVGDKKFYLNHQSAGYGKGAMTFFVPDADFNILPEGADMYLTYGEIPVSTRGVEDLDKEPSLPLWSLGKFSKALLTK